MEIQDEKKRNIYQKVEAECRKSGFGLKIKHHDLIQIAKKQGWIDQDQFTGMKVDFLQIFEITGNRDDFYLVVPWSGKFFLPYEVFSVCDGNLPQSVALKKGTFGSKWHTSDSIKNEKLFNTLSKYSKLEKGIKWEFQKSTLDFKTEIEWGIQAVPLKNNQFLFQVQSSPMSGTFSSAKFILDPFVEKRQSFTDLVKSIDYKGKSDSLFVYATKSLIVINKKYPTIYKQFPHVDEETIGSIITEIEYNQILEELAKSSTDAKEQEKDSASDLENNEQFKKLVQYQIYTQGILDPEKATKKILTDLEDKITENVTGMDEKDYQKMGCIGLLAVAIPVIIIWAAMPATIHWAVKLVLSVVSVSLTIWGIIKYMKKRIEQNINSGEKQQNG